MSVKIKQGQSKLEQAAIDARVDALKLTVDPTTKEVSETDAKRSNVKGGLAGLERAKGTSDALGIDELDRVPKTFGARVSDAVHFRQGPNAHETIKSAVMTMRGFGDQVSEFMDRGTWDFQSVNTFFRKFENMQEVFSAVTSPEVLKHASRAEINQIRSAYAELIKSFSQIQGGLVDLLNATIQPWVQKRAAAYNAESDQIFQTAPDRLLYHHWLSQAQYKHDYQGLTEANNHLNSYMQTAKALLNQKLLFN